jgi:hypothetical protein
MFEAPYFPIVYVRGYAATLAAVEDTVADPYMGFNIGSTKIRQTHTRDIARHIFESPLVRLTKDEGYRDIYEGGSELPQAHRPPAKSVWIYRYYEPVSKSLGQDFRPEIEDYAQGLGKLLDTMQRQYFTGDDGIYDEEAAKSFKVYLVAHSMGGLIVRCLLQNLSPGDPRVDKVFTYATPHGGIDLRWIGNVPSFLQYHNTENFSEKRMRKYLKISDKKKPVHSLEDKFPRERFFCLVGTNYKDYGAAQHAVGPMSDGLVQIQNAAVEGAPRAFVHRSHSGHYGIVNSEEGYQNLRRFLFGNVRVEASLEVEELTLPEEVQEAKDAGVEIRASYHVEVIARVRGVRWDLHRRTVDEESAIFGDFNELVKEKKLVRLASTFLSNKAAVEAGRQTLGFSLDLRILVPEYVVNGRWLNRDHYEGGYLYRDKINLEAERDAEEGWRLRYGFDSETPNQTVPGQFAQREKLEGGRYRFTIPVAQNTRPGFRGTLVLETSPWNA